MCPIMQMWEGAILLIVVVLLYSYKRQIDRARINARMVESFLVSSEYHYGLLGINFVLQGYYKDEVFHFYVSIQYNGSRYNLYIEPKRNCLNNRSLCFRIRGRRRIHSCVEIGFIMTDGARYGEGFSISAEWRCSRKRNCGIS